MQCEQFTSLTSHMLPVQRPKSLFQGSVGTSLRVDANSLEKTLMLGKIEGRRRRGRQRMRWLDSINNSMDNEFEQTLGDTGGEGSLAYAVLWGLKKSDRTERLNNNDRGMKSSWVCLLS